MRLLRLLHVLSVRAAARRRARVARPSSRTTRAPRVRHAGMHVALYLLYLIVSINASLFGLAAGAACAPVCRGAVRSLHARARCGCHDVMALDGRHVGGARAVTGGGGRVCVCGDVCGDVCVPCLAVDRCVIMNCV